jgi:hypothetical protein
MTIEKTCDYCKKIIENKDSDKIGYSEFCLFHFKKRRDFCSLKCLVNFVNSYFVGKIIDEIEEKKKEKDVGVKEE